MSRLAPLTLVLLCACGGPPDAVRTTLSVSARGLSQADAEIAPRYADAARDCLEESETRAEYDACLDVWDDVEAGLRAAHSGLLSAESVADAWEDGADVEAQWHATIPCLTASLRRLLHAMDAAGVEVPQVLYNALGLAARLGGECRE